MFEPLLEIQLQHSEVGGAGIPHVVPVKGNKALSSYVAITTNLQMSNVSDKFAAQYMKCVWGLMIALWGDLTNKNNMPGRSFTIGAVITTCVIGLDDASSYSYQQARKDQVTNWLMTVCKRKIEGELSDSSKGSVSCCLTITRITLILCFIYLADCRNQFTSNLCLVWSAVVILEKHANWQGNIVIYG